MAIKTNIDNVDNVSDIHGFISYSDYLKLPYLKEYTEANGIVLPTVRNDQRISADVKQPKTVKKKKVNAVAPISIVLG